MLTGKLQEERPIFLQLAQMLEDAILSGAYGEEEQIPSITEISVAYKINPATALKGVNLLVEEGLLYKRRGLGMYVAKGAKEKLAAARRERFLESYVLPMVTEAKRLGITQTELKELIERGDWNEH